MIRAVLTETSNAFQFHPLLTSGAGLARTERPSPRGEAGGSSGTATGVDIEI
jgi:hypothetical protein